MSIGNSGRIVIEVNPALKRELYSGLARDGMTLKDWFLQEVSAYLNRGCTELSSEVIVCDPHRHSPMNESALKNSLPLHLEKIKQ